MQGQAAQETGRKNRKIIINLSFTSLLTFFFIVIAAMTSAYIGGVMTGRSQAQSGHASPPERDDKRADQTAPAPILQAHELEFTQALRGEAPRPKEALKPEPEKPQSGAQEPLQAPQIESRIQPSQAPVDIGGASHDYVFQVATLKDEQAADRLRQELEGRGLRTRMERSGTLYTVMVLMRGDESRPIELGEIAQELRLGTPLLRSKKPAGPQSH